MFYSGLFCCVGAPRGESLASRHWMPAAPPQRWLPKLSPANAKCLLEGKVTPRWEPRLSLSLEDAEPSWIKSITLCTIVCYKDAPWASSGRGFCPSFLLGNVSFLRRQSFLIYCLNRCTVQERTKRGFTLFLKRKEKNKRRRNEWCILYEESTGSFFCFWG